MDSRVDSIIRLARENHIFLEDVSDYEANVVCVNISWGDWKHDHLRMKHLLSSFFGTKILEIESIVTEENGSDCYSATHVITFA